MRRPRMKAPASHDKAFYHCVSRVVNREFVFGTTEKEKFVAFMRTYERLYGLKVLTYCVMSNHFHILVEVPRRPEESELPCDRDLVSHVRKCLGDKQADALGWELKHFRSQKNEQAAEALRERWFARMWDVSAFMKVLKQRFTQWFNREHNRRGTLWEDRFRSVLVQGEGHVLKAMAAYIELNPVRAKICDDPKDYRWCGYGEAVAGGKVARQALVSLADLSSSGGRKVEAQRPKTIRQSMETWRCFLFGVPESIDGGKKRSRKDAESRIFKRRGLSKKKSLEVLETGGELSEMDYLRCRVRYFTDGAVIGGRKFVGEFFKEYKERFGERRQLKGVPLNGLKGAKAEGDEGGFYAMRNLQKEVFG